MKAKEQARHEFGEAGVWGRRERRGGVVLVIVMLGIFVLCGLVMWVLNLGDQVNRRVSVQHSADAAARGAAGWAARSLNTVAANNTAMARYLALVNVMEAMPLATRYALWEAEALTARLGEQDAVGYGGVGSRVLNLAVSDAYGLLLGEMLGDLNQLRPMAGALDGFDTRGLTHWAEGGSLWVALEAMDDLNQATMAGLGQTVSDGGVSGGLANLPDDEIRNVDGAGRAAAVVLPFDGGVDVERGVFDDFLYPVIYGRLPVGVDDAVVGRGPFDVLWGWRDGVYADVISSGGGGSVNTNPRPSGGPGNPLSRTGSRGGGGSHEHLLVGYETYGPQERMLRDMRGSINTLMRTTRYDKYLRELADAIRAHVWPNLPEEMVLPDELHQHLYGDDRQLRTPAGRFADPADANGAVMSGTVAPEWVTDYVDAVDIAKTGDPEIQETAWFIVEIKSRYAEDDSRFMSDGSWAYEQHVGGAGYDNPRVSIVRGWQAPESGSWGGVLRLGDYVWRSSWTDWAISDADIGLDVVYKSVTGLDGVTRDVPAWQEVYRVDTFVFGGVNVGELAEVPNPYAGFDPLAEGAPSPLHLTRGTARSDGENMSVLAIAKRPDTPQAWGDRFRGGRPDPSVMGMAQAKVFNNHSLDLWTQQWRAELDVVRDYDGWLEQLGAEGDLPEGVNGADVEAFRKYLLNARDLARLLMEH